MTTQSLALKPSGGAPSPTSTTADNRADRVDRVRDQARLWGIRLLIVVALVSAWQLLSGRVFPLFLISSPALVFDRLVDWLADGSLIGHLVYTMGACLMGFAIGATIGSTLGLLFGIYGSVARVISPFAAMLYSTPKIMLSPLIIVWVGVDLTMKVFVATVACMWVIFYNVWTATRTIDHNLLDQFRLMGASQRQIIAGLYLPSALTWLLTSLRVAFPVALIGAVVGEFIASSKGLGYLALNSGHKFDSAGVIVAVLAITTTAMTIDQILAALQRKAALWQGEGARG